MTQPSFTQVAVRVRYDNANETTAMWMAAQNASASPTNCQSFRVRFLIDETASRAWTNKNWNLYYSLNGAAYAAVNDTTPIYITTSNNFTNGDNTTSQLTGGAGAFLTANAGMIDALGGATNTGAAGNYFETEFCVKLDPTQVAQSDNIKLYIRDGNAEIAAYTNRIDLWVQAKYLNSPQQGQTSGNITLTAHAPPDQAIPDSVIQLQISTMPDLVQHYVIPAVDNAIQAQASDKISLSQRYIVTIQNAQQSQSADNNILVQNFLLFVLASIQAQAADNIVLSVPAGGVPKQMMHYIRLRSG